MLFLFAESENKRPFVEQPNQCPSRRWQTPIPGLRASGPTVVVLLLFSSRLIPLSVSAETTSSTMKTDELLILFPDMDPWPGGHRDMAPGGPGESGRGCCPLAGQSRTLRQTNPLLGRYWARFSQWKESFLPGPPSDRVLTAKMALKAHPPLHLAQAAFRPHSLRQTREKLRQNFQESHFWCKISF